VEKKIDIKECIRFGWTAFKTRPFYFAGIFLLFAIIQQIFNYPSNDKNLLSQHDPWMIGLSIVALIVSVLIDMLLRSFALHVHDNPRTATLRESWVPGVMVQYMLAAFLVGLSVVCGFVLLIVPGILFAMALLFTPYLVLEKKLGPITAMKESIALTKGHRMQLFGLTLAIILLNVLGFVALFVGLLVTLPVSMFALAHAYRTLSGNAAVERAGESAEVVPAS
jgi:hypothetical protein